MSLKMNALLASILFGYTDGNGVKQPGTRHGKYYPPGASMYEIKKLRYKKFKVKRANRKKRYNSCK